MRRRSPEIMALSPLRKMPRMRKWLSFYNFRSRD
jgi:hypothetical protein